jgi:hypothetical protein
VPRRVSSPEVPLIAPLIVPLLDTVVEVEVEVEIGGERYGIVKASDIKVSAPTAPGIKFILCNEYLKPF